MPIEKTEFRHALGQFASAVTVVTTAVEGVRLGITVTAFSSLSLAPPLVLICIDHHARMHDRLKRGGSFAVNFLAEHQQHLSQRFASREPDPFEGVAIATGPLGNPLIDETVAAIECTIMDLLPGGDHTIVVGRVETTQVRGGNPLIHFRGTYHRLV